MRVDEWVRSPILVEYSFSETSRLGFNVCLCVCETAGTGAYEAAKLCLFAPVFRFRQRVVEGSIGHTIIHDSVLYSPSMEIKNSAINSLCQ
jgi:hypothetical protein